ncbi:MAG: type II secretion system F family protein [Elusimicrobiota bacterium]|jgi:type IV pilus assembly protein PilC|nr:type II secretion system F family protein [Elusimicrobiota bacterium]
MAKFVYNAQDSRGRNYKGAINAESRDKALEYLQSKGVLVIDISVAAAKKGLFKSGAGGGKIPGHVMAFFAEQLATLIAGGVPLVRAISLLGEYSTDKNLGAVLLGVARDVAGGNSLHGALERYPKVFNYTWLSMVQAGEVGGHLSEALLQIAKYVKSTEMLKSKIITAITYPAILFIMSVGVLIYFVVGIVPTFAAIFKDFDMTLPALTLFILAVSTVIREHIFLLILGLAGAGFAFYLFISTPAGKRAWHTFHLKVPIFGSFIRNIYFERVLSTMATLLNSGVSIINVLNVMEDAFAGNVIIRDAVINARRDVASGKSISEAFRRAGVFPGLMTEMMLMGEESGRLPGILDTLSKFYSEQINQFIARFSALIDPILVVGIGAIIGVVVLSIFMPIFKMSQIGMSSGGSGGGM